MTIKLEMLTNIPDLHGCEQCANWSPTSGPTLGELPKTAWTSLDREGQTANDAHGRSSRMETNIAQNQVLADLDRVRAARPEGKAFWFGVPALQSHENPFLVCKVLRPVVEKFEAICVNGYDDGSRLDWQIISADKNANCISAIGLPKLPIVVAISETTQRLPIEATTLIKGEDVRRQVRIALTYQAGRDSSHPRMFYLWSGMEYRVWLATRGAKPNSPKPYALQQDAKAALQRIFGVHITTWSAAAIYDAINPAREEFVRTFLTMVREELKIES